MSLVPAPYHVGIVVSDLESAKQELHELIGLSWCKQQSGPLELDTRAGRISTRIDFVYSLGGPPNIELILRRPGTPWESLGLHHLGFWSDDSAAESRRFDERGFMKESVCLDATGRPTSGLYHLNADNLRLELVNIATSGPRFARYLTGNLDYA